MSDDEESNPFAKVYKLSIQGKWICNVCNVPNDNKLIKCESCTALREGYNDEKKDNNTDNNADIKSLFGSNNKNKNDSGYSFQNDIDFDSNNNAFNWSNNDDNNDGNSGTNNNVFEFTFNNESNNDNNNDNDNVFGFNTGFDSSNNDGNGFSLGITNNEDNNNNNNDSNNDSNIKDNNNSTQMSMDNQTGFTFDSSLFNGTKMSQDPTDISNMFESDTKINELSNEMKRHSLDHSKHNNGFILKMKLIRKYINTNKNGSIKSLYFPYNHKESYIEMLEESQYYPINNTQDILDKLKSNNPNRIQQHKEISNIFNKLNNDDEFNKLNENDKNYIYHYVYEYICYQFERKTIKTGYLYISFYLWRYIFIIYIYNIEIEKLKRKNDDIICVCGDGSISGILGIPAEDQHPYYLDDTICNKRYYPTIVTSELIMNEMDGFSDIYSGTQQIAVLNKDGTKVFVWGVNEQSQLSIKPLTTPNIGDDDDELPFNRALNKLYNEYKERIENIYNKVDKSKINLIPNWLDRLKKNNNNIEDISNNMHDLYTKVYKKYSDKNIQTALLSQYIIPKFTSTTNNINSNII